MTPFCMSLHPWLRVALSHFVILCVLCRASPLQPERANGVSRHLLDVNCSAVLVETGIFTGVVISDDTWRMSDEQLQPLIDCLPPQDDAIVVFNTTQVLKMSKTVIRDRRSVMFTSLAAFNERLRTDGAAFDEETMPRLQCHSTQPFLQIQGSDVILDHLKIENCQLKKGPVLLVDGSLTLQNSIMQDILGKKGTALIKGNPHSSISMQNTTFRRNKGPIILRGLRNGRLRIMQCQFSGNSVKGNGFVTLDRQERFQLVDTFFERQMGRSLFLKDTSAAIHNCTFFNNEGREGTVLAAKALRRESKVAFSNCQFDGNRASGFGGCLSLKGPFLDILLLEVLAVGNSARQGGVMFAENLLGMEISTSQFLNNEATAQGGALFSKTKDRFGAALRISDSRILNNSAAIGGGVSIEGPVKMEIGLDTVFAYNTAREIGGALRLGRSVQSTISDSTLQFNEAMTGGGIYCRGGFGNRNGTLLRLRNARLLFNSATNGGALFLTTSLLEVSNDTFFTNNEAESKGGAIYALNGAQMSLSDCTLSLNRAREGGGISAIDDQYNKISIRLTSDVKLQNNSASLHGGGLHLVGRGVGLKTGNKVHLEFNEAKEGGAIYLVDAFRFMTEQTFFAKNKAERGGALFATAHKKKVEISLGSTLFDGNEADSGGAVYLLSSDMTQGTVMCHLKKRTEFLLNRATQDGGAMFISGSSVLSTNHAYFNQNKAQENGGAISTQEGATLVSIRMRDSVFEGNDATYGGAMSVQAAALVDAQSNVNFTNNKALVGGAMFLSSDIQLKAKQTMFADNSATHTEDGGGAIYCKAKRSASVLSLTDTVFHTNRAQPPIPSQLTAFNSSGGALYVKGDVNLTLLSVQLSQNQASRNGGAVFVGEASHLTIESCEMTQNRAEVNGGAVYLQNLSDTSNISGSSFSSNSAVHGGALYLSDMSFVITFQELTLTDNSATRSGGAIHARDASLKVLQTKFWHNRAGNTAFDGNQCPEEQQITFSSGFSSGGAVHVEDLERRHITTYFKKTDFFNNTADVGGSMSLASLSSVEIMKCHFRKNEAQLGGGVFLEITSLKTEPLSSLTDTRFFKNSACQGGAIFGYSEPDNGGFMRQSVMLADVHFQDNFAKTSGAALHTPSNPEAFLLCCDCARDDRFHLLDSSLLESFPTACEPRMKGNSVGRRGYGSLFSTGSAGFEVTPERIENHRSGEVLETVFVRDVDALGQTVPFSDEELSLTADDVVLKGENQTHSDRGSAIFDGLFLSALPGDYVLSVMHEKAVVGEIPVSVMPCGVGETLEGLICQKCDDGSFTQGEGGSCLRCPEHSRCEDGYVLPQNGYWNDDPSSTKVIKCIRPDACRTESTSLALSLRSQDATEQIIREPCAEGYEGPLCGSCVEDYGHMGAQECQECHAEWSRSFAALLVLYLFLAALLLIKTSWVYDIGNSNDRRVQHAALELDTSTTDINTITVDGDGDEAPIPEHLEPISSFGIRGSRAKEMRRTITDRFMATTSNNQLKQTRSAPASPTTSPRELPTVMDDPTTSRARFRTEICPEIQMTKPRSRILPLEEVDAITESHVLLKPLLSEALKTLLTFFQSVSLALYVQINWSDTVRAILRLFNFLGTGSSPYFSLECLFNERSEKPASVQSFMFLLLAPVLVSVFFLFISLLFFLLDRSLSVLFHRVKNSLVAVFYLSFLPICHTCFRAMNCTSLSLDSSHAKEYMWIEDTEVICYEGAHRELLFYVCLPLLFLTLIVFPFSFTVFLLLHRNLGKTEHLRSWGLLFEAYKYKRRYWEFTIFVRKVLLAAVFAFGYRFSIQTQTLVAIGIIVFFLLAHSITSPYEKPERLLSHMETISLFGAFLVYFAACLIHALDEGNDIIFVILCVVLIAVFLRLFIGVVEHLIRTVDWTLGEFGKESYYSKPWVMKFGMVCRLKCSFFSTRMQRVLKRWVSHT